MERLLRLHRPIKELNLKSGSNAEKLDKKIRLLFRLTSTEISFLYHNLNIYEVLAMQAIIANKATFTQCRLFLQAYNKYMLLYRQLLCN